MNMKKLTFPCIILLATLAVSSLLAQEQHAEAGADQTVSADSAQPADTTATPPPRAASPSVQPAGEAGANAEAARPSAAAAPKPAVKAEAAAAELQRVAAAAGMTVEQLAAGWAAKRDQTIATLKGAA